MRQALAILAAATVLAGCRTQAPVDEGGLAGRSFAARLDRGRDWAVASDTDVWKILVPEGNRQPRHAGFVVARSYRQVRGGPEFRIYEVTSLDRREILGHVDAMGRAVRYEPRRGGGTERVSVGTSSLDASVGAILDTTAPVTLEPTTERRIAFDLLDTDRNGLLQGPELASVGDRIAGADANRDGAVDFQEFDALDRL